MMDTHTEVLDFIESKGPMTLFDMANVLVGDFDGSPEEHRRLRKNLSNKVRYLYGQGDLVKDGQRVQNGHIYDVYKASTFSTMDTRGIITEILDRYGPSAVPFTVADVARITRARSSDVKRAMGIMNVKGVIIKTFRGPEHRATKDYYRVTNDLRGIAYMWRGLE